MSRSMIEQELERARREAASAEAKGIGRTVHHDVVERLEAALADPAEAAFGDMTRNELEELAEAYGVMPDEGSGVDGAVLKEDILEALEEIDG